MPSPPYCLFYRFSADRRIAFENFPDSLFGIEEYAAADGCIGDLPCIAQRLKRPGREVQILAHFISVQVAFVSDRGYVVRFGFAQARSIRSSDARAFRTSSLSAVK